VRRGLRRRPQKDWHRTGPVAQHGRMDFDVHRIRAEEWPKYKRLRLEALKDSPLAFVEQYDESLAQSDSFWQDRVRRGAGGGKRSLFVAENDGSFVAKAAGFVETDITDHVSAHVVGVYTTPDWRGRRASDAVVSAVVAWARQDARADRIRLFVTETNDRAAAFYRRLGFRATGATMVYPPDPNYLEHEMEYHGQ
jgi:ribosomal protein S18 acetylase RimI-like enzyme